MTINELSALNSTYVARAAPLLAPAKADPGSSAAEQLEVRWPCKGVSHALSEHGWLRMQGRCPATDSDVVMTVPAWGEERGKGVLAPPPHH